MTFMVYNMIEIFEEIIFNDLNIKYFRITVRIIITFHCILGSVKIDKYKTFI